jgi:hypothetical protein
MVAITGHHGFNPALIATLLQPYDPRYSPDWGLVKEQEAQKRREQAEQQAAEHEADAREQQAANGRGTAWW